MTFRTVAEHGASNICALAAFQASELQEIEIRECGVMLVSANGTGQLRMPRSKGKGNHEDRGNRR